MLSLTQPLMLRRSFPSSKKKLKLNTCPSFLILNLLVSIAKTMRSTGNATSATKLTKRNMKVKHRRVLIAKA